MLKMIFSVQNNNLMFSVKISGDLVQTQVRETVCGVFPARLDIPIQVWHMVEVMRRDFSEQHTKQVPMTVNQLGEMQMMEEVAEHVGTNYPKLLTLDIWLNHPTSSSFLGKRDLWTTQLSSNRMMGSLNQELQSANHQDNHQ